MAVSWDDRLVRERAVRAAMRGIIRGTEEIKNEAVSLILNTPKTGRTYYHRSVTHVASAPGEPPASDTGRLVNSIETVYNFAELSGVVRVTAAYGPYLEYGTQTMEPRPFLRPAIANKRGVVARYVQEEIAREFR